MASRITIQLVGSASDKEAVRLNDFIEQLRNVKKSLVENDRLLSNTGEPVLDYKIVDLRHRSPYTVVLEPVFRDPVEGLPDNYAPRVIQDFSDELKRIRRDGRLAREPEINRLEAYRNIGYQPESQIQKMMIIVGRTTVTVDRTFQTKLEKIIGPDEIVEGSVSGMLEAINLHNTNKFVLYPTIGPSKVSGVFPPRLRPQVKEAIGAFVTVNGRLKYKSWSPFPHSVIAERIDAHPPDDSLPKMSEMRGIFKGMTGELNSFEFVEKLRNESWA